MITSTFLLNSEDVDDNDVNLLFYLKHDHKYIPVKLKLEVLIWFLQL